MTTTKKITSSQINARIQQVAKLGTAFNSYVHETALMIVRHSAPVAAGPECVGFGDCTRAVKLVRAMPASMRRTMLIAWFKAFTPIRIKLSDNGDKCEYDPKYKALSPTDKLTWWKLTEAAETSFADMAEDTPEAVTYDLPALIEMIRRTGKRILADIEKGKVANDDVENARLLAQQVTGFKFVGKAAKPARKPNKPATAPKKPAKLAA